MAGYNNNGINNPGDSDVTMEDTNMMSNDNATTDMLEEYGVWVKVEPEVIEEKKDEEKDYLATLDKGSIDETDTAGIEISEKEEEIKHISFDDLEIPSEEDIDSSEFDTNIESAEEKASIEDMEELSIDDFLETEETGEAEINAEESIDEGTDEKVIEESEEETGDTDIDISLDELEEKAEEDLIPGLEEEIELSEEEIAIDESEIAGTKDTEELPSDRMETGKEAESMEPDIDLDKDIDNLSEDELSDIEMEDIPELELEENIDEIALDTGDEAIKTTSEDTFIEEEMPEYFEAVEQIKPDEAIESEGMEEIEVPLSEKMPEQRFDDLETIETDLKTSIAKNEKFETIDTTSILNKIEKELYSIKKDLSHLKKDLSELRKPSHALHAESEIKVSSPDTSGFFDQEEDETIALTGDELNNILNTAEITEEVAEETAVVDEDMGFEESKGESALAEGLEVESGETGIGSIELEETPIEETWDESPRKVESVRKKPSSEISDEEIIDDFAPDKKFEELDTGEFIEVESTGEEDKTKDEIQGIEEAGEMEFDKGVSETEGVGLEEELEETKIEEKITEEDEIELEEGFTDEGGFGTEESISELEEAKGEEKAEPLSEDLLNLNEEIDLEIPEEEIFEEKDTSLKESSADDVFFDADEEETSSLEAEIDEVIASDFQGVESGIEEADVEDLIAEEESLEPVDETRGTEKVENEEEIIDVSIHDEELELELPDEDLEETIDLDAVESDEAIEEGIGEKKEEVSAADRDESSLEEVDISEFGMDEEIEDIKAKIEGKTIPVEEEITPETEESALVDETPEEITITAEEPSMTPSIESPEDQSSEIEIMPEKLKTDLKSVLSYMDELLENLPDDKIKEFSRSNYWITYKKLFEELGIAPKDSEIYSGKV